MIERILCILGNQEGSLNLMDIIRDKNLVKPKGTKRRVRQAQNIVNQIKEDRAKEWCHNFSI